MSYGRGGRGGSRGGRGGYNRAPEGPPDTVVEMGMFMHPCEGDMVCARVPAQEKIPYFNAPIYLENKTMIGKVDEILGPMTELYFTVKLQPGVVATSFKPKDKVYIATDKLLPLDRFLPKPKVPGGKVSKPMGRQDQGRGASRGRGGMRGY
ncbi:H/ACA ribonucleoprotein complex, subunit Gar1/Naf1 [Gorgonomyces haynaldii]|nr:H/ACA ribonucleoprotein complex, subunit Gar1/Naf1 [Gorgonomyces haynaldii]